MIRNLKEKTIRMLRWSERYTKTDMVYFFKGNFWLNVNQALSILTGLALSIAFARLLTRDAYGTYTFALAVIGLFSMPMTTGLGGGILKGVSRGSNALIYQGMRIILPWSIGAGATLAALGGYYAFAGNSVLAICFVLGGILLPILVATGAAKSFLNSKGDFALATTFNSWRTPVMTLLLILVAWKFGSALSVVVASMIGNAILSLSLFTSVKKKYGLKPTMEHTGEHFNRRYALHSGILSIFSYLSGQIDDLLLWRFVGAAPVAVYTYAIAPITGLRTLVENQSSIATPKFAQKEFADVKKNILFRIKQLYFIAIPVTVVYIFLAPYIFHFLFPKYLDAVILSQFASISLLSAPRRLIGAAISAHQRIKESYIATIAPNIARIVLAVLLVPIFGIKGAVAALLISEVVDYIILGTLMRNVKSA